MNKIIQQIELIKIKTRKETGSFKYDFAYDECIEIYNRLSPWGVRWAKKGAKEKQAKVQKKSWEKFIKSLPPEDLKVFYKKRGIKISKAKQIPKENYIVENKPRIWKNKRTSKYVNI